MDDAAVVVHVIEPKEDLLRDLLDKRNGNPFILVLLDEAE
jgi:hypothetical protein